MSQQQASWSGLEISDCVVRSGTIRYVYMLCWPQLCKWLSGQQLQALSILRTVYWPHLREEALSQHRQLLRQLPACQMHDTLLETLVQGVHVVPGLLVNICFVACIPLNLLPSPKGSLDARLEVVYAFILK